MKQVDRNIFKGICAVIAGGLILLGLIYYGKDLFNLLSNMDQMKAFLEQFGASSMLVGILLYAAQILIAILPGEIIEVLFGVLYGSIGGMAFCLVGNLIGSTLIFLLTKRYGKKFVQRFISEEKMDKISFFKDESRLNAVTFIL
ncbi:TVP38/TMEM64 family protein, partial [Dielma fastidiosa]